MSHTASILTAVLLCLGSAASSAHDPVVAGFERMLDQQPTHLRPAATVAREPDPLLETIVAALRGQRGSHPLARAQATQATDDDPVAASFARMLDHEPNRAPVAVPAGFGEDPLYAAIVVPLHRGNGLYPVGPIHAGAPRQADSH